MCVYHENVLSAVCLQQPVGVNHFVFTDKKKKEIKMSQNTTGGICRQNYCTKKISQNSACVSGKDKQLISRHLELVEMFKN